MYGSRPTRSTPMRASSRPPKKPMTIARPRPTANSCRDDSSACGSSPLFVIDQSAETVFVNGANEAACVCRPISSQIAAPSTTPSTEIDAPRRLCGGIILGFGSRAASTVLTLRPGSSRVGSRVDRQQLQLGHLLDRVAQPFAPTARGLDPAVRHVVDPV